MYCRVIFYVLPLLGVLQNIFKVKLSAYACKDDIECKGNSLNASSISICCSGLCQLWWNCSGGCISDDSCSGGKICFQNRCQDDDLFFPAYCDYDLDCSKNEECESGQCKPAPRPVPTDASSHLSVRFHFDINVVVIISAVVGGLIFLAVVGYGSYRFLKRYRRRRFSRGLYSQPSRNSFESYSLCRQHSTPRIIFPGRTLRPPPEYDSVTLDSNLEVESPPPYDQHHVTSSSRSSEEQVWDFFSLCFVLISMVSKRSKTCVWLHVYSFAGTHDCLIIIVLKHISPFEFSLPKFMHQFLFLFVPSSCTRWGTVYHIVWFVCFIICT